MSLLASIIVVSFRPTGDRHRLAERSFAEIHNTGIIRESYELIVVDNGGWPFEWPDPDLVIRLDRNAGQAAGMNIGAAAARSDTLAFVDDDLGYTDGWLYEGRKLLREYPEKVVSLRAVPEKYITSRTTGGHHFARNVGGCWMMPRRIYNLVGRFGDGYFDFGGLWTRNLLRRGRSFVVSDVPYQFHLGDGQSIIGDNREFIRTYRRKNE